MIRLVVLSLCLVVAGCVTKPIQRTQVVTVEVPVKVPCIDKAPERPAFRYGKGEWPGDKVAVSILADDFERAERWGTAWEAAAAGCVVQQK